MEASNGILCINRVFPQPARHTTGNEGWLTYAEATRRVMLVQIENVRTYPSVLTAMSTSISLLGRPVTVPLSALIVFR